MHFGLFHADTTQHLEFPWTLFPRAWSGIGENKGMAFSYSLFIIQLEHMSHGIISLGSWRGSLGLGTEMVVEILHVDRCGRLDVNMSV